jgi:hypothetical protein
MRKLSAKEIMLWYCNNAAGAEILSEARIAAATAGVLMEEAPIDEGSSSSNWNTYRDTANRIGVANSQRYRILNHLLAVDEQCPYDDLFTYLSNSDNGLMTSEHLWVGIYSSSALYDKYQNSFPMDAFTVIERDLDQEVVSGLASWWTNTFKPSSSNDIVEPWLYQFADAATDLTPHAYSLGDPAVNLLRLWPEEETRDFRKSNGDNPPPLLSYLFDAVYAAQIAVMEARRNFGDYQDGYIVTSDNLLKSLKSLDFQGLTGRVQFDPSRNRNMKYSVAQFQRAR